MKTVQSYVKNVAKSMVFSAADVGKKMMPEVGEFATENKEFFTTSYAALKNPASSSRKVINSIKESKVFQAVDYGAKNLLEDLKSGDFYNKARAERDELKLAGLDTNWDDLSEFGVESDWEEHLGEDSGSASEVTKGDKQIVNAINSSSGASTSATVNAIITTSNIQSETTKASTGILYQQNERLFNGLHNDLGAVDETLRGINNMLASSLQNIDSNLADYFTEDLKLSQERNAILKEMLEMQRNQYKTAAQREEEASRKSSGKGKLRWRDVSLSGGTINLSKYFDNVTTNIKNQFSSLGISGFSEDSNMLATFMVAPMRTITETLINAVIPATIKEATKELNGTISGVFGTLMGRAANAANRNQGGIIGTLVNLLGINTSVNSRIDTSKYEKGPVSWDGISRKALTDVIPTYLRQIAAALTGQPEQIFDYNSGRWSNAHEGGTARRNIHTNAVRSGTQELRNTMEYGKRAVGFDNTYDQDQFDQGWEEFWEYIYQNNGQFNPSKTMEQNHIDMAKYPHIRRYYRIYCTIWQESELGTYVDSRGRRRERGNYSTRMQAANRIMSAKDTEEQQYREAERNGGLISQYYAVGGKAGVDKHGTWNNDRFDFNGALLNAKDKEGNTIFNYLYNIQAELKWQNDNWLSGGGYGGSNRGPAPTLTERPNVSLRNQSKIIEDRNASNKKAREEAEYKKRIDDAVKKGEAFRAAEFDGMDMDVFLAALKSYQNEHAAEEHAAEVNEYINKNILYRYADKIFGAEITVSQNRKDDIVQGLKNNDIPVDHQESTFLTKVMDNLKKTGNVAKAIGSGAAETVTNMLYVADKAIYDMFFKTEIKNDSGKDYSGFMEFFTSKAKDAFENMKNKINDKILNPLKEKLKNLFDDDFKKEFKDSFKNMGKTLWSTFKDANKDVYGNAARKAAETVAPKQYAQWQKNQDIKKAEKARKEEESRIQYAPDIVYAGSGEIPYNLRLPAPGQTTTGTATFGAKDTASSAYGRGYFSGNTMLSRNEVLLNRAGATTISGTGLYHISQPSVILNSSQAYDAGFTSTRGNPKADLSREQRMAHGMGLSTNAEGTTEAVENVIPGSNKTITEADVKEYVAEAQTTAKSHKGAVAAGGVAGAAVSTVLGLVGGPLVGAAVGAGTTLIAKSDKFKDIIFGKVDEEGNRQGGIVPKTIMDTVKKYAPDAMKFGLAGIIPGLLTPLGPLGGMMVGAGIGILKNNENFMNKYFGENGLLHFSDKEKKTITKLLPGAGKGAAIGAGASLLFGPFGIVGGAAIGSAIGMMTTTDEFKEGIMGKKINGVRVGGLLNGIKDTFRPLGETFIDFGKRMRDLLDDHIVKPIKDFLVPAIHALPRALGAIPRAINKAFGEKFGRSMTGMLQDVIKGPVNKMVNAALMPVRGAANVATLPFRGLGAVGNRMRRRQIRNGNADYMTAEERISWDNDNGYGGDISDFDRALAGIGTEDGVSVEDAKTLRDNLQTISMSSNQAFGQARSQWKAIEKYLDNYRTESGQAISPKSKKAIRAALESGDADRARALLRQATIQGSKVTLSNSEVESLYNGGLNDLMTGYTTAYDRYRTISNATDASRSELAGNITKGMANLGVNDFNVQNVDDVRRYIKLLDTEITNREASKENEGISLDEDSNDQLHQIVESTTTLTQILEDMAAGNTEYLKQRSNEREAERKENERRMKDEEEANKARIEKALGSNTTSQLSDKAKDELTRTTKNGRSTTFFKDVANGVYSVDVVNSVGEYGHDKEVKKLIGMGFQVTPEAAEIIASKRKYDLDVIDSFITNYVSYIFAGHAITPDDIQFCFDHRGEREKFKQRCAILAKSSVDYGIGEGNNRTSRFTSFASILPTDKDDERVMLRLLDEANQELNAKKKHPIKAIKNGLKTLGGNIKKAVQRRIDFYHQLRDEGYTFSDDGADYAYELDMFEAGQISKFFNKHMEQLYGHGKHEFTAHDIKLLQNWALDIIDTRHLKERIKVLAKANASASEYPTLEIIFAIKDTELDKLKQEAKANRKMNKFVRRFLRPIGRLIKRAIGIGITTSLKRDGYSFAEGATDLLDGLTIAETRKAYKFFNRNVLHYYRGYDITVEDIQYVISVLDDDGTAKEFKRRCGILAKSAEYRLLPKLSFKAVMELKAGTIERLKTDNASRTRRGRIARTFKRVGKAIKVAFTKLFNPDQAFKAAGFSFTQDAEEHLNTLATSSDKDSQAEFKDISRFLTMRAGTFFKGYDVTLEDLNYCTSVTSEVANEFNRRCRILTNAGKNFTIVTLAEDGQAFSGLMKMDAATINRYAQESKRRTLFGQIANTLRKRFGRNNKSRLKRRHPLRNLFNRFTGNNYSSGNPPEAGAAAEAAESTEVPEGEPVETNGIGTMLLSGAKAVGKAVVKGAKAVKNGVSNFFSKDSSGSSRGGLISRARKAIGGGDSAPSGTNGGKNAAIGVIDFGKGRIGKARTDSSGSIIPDTSDSRTKQYVDEVAEEKSVNDQLVEKQLKVAEMDIAANDTSEYNKNGKKKMGWIQLLLFGGLLWKSGILKKLYEGFIKPIWTDAIKPWITDKVVPWITDTAIPAIGNMLGKILPNIIVNALKLLPSIFGGMLDTLTGGNSTNAGATTTTDVNEYNDEDNKSTYYDENGMPLSYEDVQNGNFTNVYNEQGTKGTVEYDDDGNVENITFKDRSVRGSSYAKRAVNATVHAAAKTKVGKFTKAVDTASTKLLKSKSLTAKAAGAAGKAVTGTEKTGVAIGNAIRNRSKNKTALTVVENPGEATNWAAKVWEKAEQLLDRMFNSEGKVAKWFNKIAEKFGGSKAGTWLKNFKTEVKDTFKQASDMITDTKVAKFGKKAKELLNKLPTRVIFAAVDFLLGVDRAESILGVSECGVGEQVIAGILNAVINQIPIINMIPGAKWIIQKLFKWVDKYRKNEDQTFEERQAEADKEAEEYNEEHGTTYSTEEYLATTKSVSGKVMSKVKGGVQKAWKAAKNYVLHPIQRVKNQVNTVKNIVTNVGSKIKEKTQERKEKSQDMWDTLSGKLTKMFTASAEGDLDALDEAAEDDDGDAQTSSILASIKDLITPKTQMNKCLDDVNDTMADETKGINNDDTDSVIQRARNGEISVFSKEYWSLANTGTGLAGAFNKVKGFTERLVNAPIALIQGLFRKLCNAISNIGEWIKEKFSWITDFMAHPFRFIWNKIRGKSDEDAGTEEIEGTEISEEDLEYVAEDSGISDEDDDWDVDVSAGGKFRRYGRGRRRKFGTGYVKQIDPKIKNLPFNISGDHEKQTIGDSACGPAAAVNAVKAFYGKGSSELVSAANMAINGGYKEIDGGTYPEYFTDYFAQNGLGSSISTNTSNIASRIRAGEPTVLMGQDTHGVSSSTPFGKQSHYVTVTGTDSFGRAIVQDPESKYDNQLYNINELMNKTQLGISAYGKYRKHAARGKNYLKSVRNFTRYARGKYGRGTNNGVMFITDTAGYYIRKLMKEGGHDVGGCYRKAKTFEDAEKSLSRYIKNHASKHEAIVIMLGLKDVGYDTSSRNDYQDYIDLISENFNAWDTDIYMVSVNPLPKGKSLSIKNGDTATNQRIIDWNDNLQKAIEEYGNDRVYFVDTYSLIEEDYVMDEGKVVGKVTDKGYDVENTNIFYNDTTNEMIYEYILSEVAEYTGEDAIATDSCSASSIMSSIFDTITDFVMDNTKAGQVYQLVFGSQTSSSEDEGDTSSEETLEDEEEYYDEDQYGDEEDDYDDDYGEGKHGRGKFGRSVRKAARGIKHNRIARYGRGKFGRGTAEKVWYALRNYGFSEAGAAGIMGNLEAESGLLANNLQNDYEKSLGMSDTEYTNAVDNGTYNKFDSDSAGYGLAQWTYSTRKANLHNYANSKNASISDLAMQLNFLANELNGSYNSLAQYLKSATSVSDASNKMLTEFERAGDMSSSVKSYRASLGQAWYDKLHGTEGEKVEIGDVVNGGDDYSSSSSGSNSTTDTITSIINSYLADTKANAVFEALTGSSMVGDSSGSSSSSSNGTASDVANTALAEVGVTETPSNYVKYNDWYYGYSNAGGDDKPWCAAFVSWVANQAGVPTSIIKKSAYTVDEYNYLTGESGGKAVKNSQAQPGDIMFLTDNGSSSGIYHTGIVVGNDGSTLTTVEGNSSNAVSQRTYNTSKSEVLVARPNYPTSTSNSTVSIDSSLSTEGATDYASTLGGNPNKPISKYGTFKRGIYGMGRRRVKDKNGSFYVEESDVDRELGLRLQAANVDDSITYGKGTYGRAASISANDQYTALLEAVLKVLMTIADNTDRLNTIVNLISNYIDLNASDTDVADATKAQSLKSQLNGILGGLDGSGATSRINQLADDAADSSIYTIINAMNAIASE